MTPRISIRVLVSTAVGLIIGLCCFFLLRKIGSAAGDFTWAYNAANDLLNGRDPYRHEVRRFWTPYPLPTALVAVPFTMFSPEIAGATFFGLSSALMVYGFSQKGFLPLLVLLSYPFYANLQWAQWSPLIVASAFLPALMFVSVIKPNIAAPVVLLHWRVIGIITTSILLICSLIIYPTWPIKWLSQLSHYEGYVPLLTIPGPLLLLALTRWRERDAQFLLVASIFPQRWFYDALILWLIPKTRKEFLYSVTFSWGAYFWRLYHMPETSLERGLVVTLFFYLPMLFIILMRKREVTQKLEEITSGAPQ